MDSENAGRENAGKENAARRDGVRGTSREAENESPDVPLGTPGCKETCKGSYEADGERVLSGASGDARPGRLGRALQGVLHLLLPCPCLGCRRPVESPTTSPGLCVACLGRLVPLPAAEVPGAAPETDGNLRPRAAFEYRPPLDEVILALKFRRLDYLSEALAELALPAVRLAAGDGPIDAVVPVPLHWRRIWTRGYDQAALLAAGLARRLGVPILPALRRVRATPAQSLRARDARRRNLAGAFALRRGMESRIGGRALLLVDDVVTTGSTLAEAGATLRRAGARVRPFAVAWTPEDEAGGEGDARPSGVKMVRK